MAPDYIDLHEQFPGRVVVDEMTLHLADRAAGAPQQHEHVVPRATIRQPGAGDTRRPGAHGTVPAVG